MPCNIGWQSYAKIEIPVPAPQEFSVKSEAPEIDADLLEKLGVEDPEFLAWVQELNTKPLLQEALKRTLAVMGLSKLDFSIDENGMLQAKGTFTSLSEKRRLSEAASDVSDRWQFEILGIVAELLDYTATITKKGDEMILEAEERGKTHPCDYIKVTRTGDVSEITFEHFKSKEKLELAEAKFTALADKLGVKISIKKRDAHEGDPFPNEVRHDHEHGHAHTHRDGHSHDHKH
jgi:hypothetical protein